MSSESTNHPPHPTSAASAEDHDRAVRRIAATRYPFPDQVDWPADYITLKSTDGPTRGVAVPGLGEVFPDIVIVDGQGVIREIGEVEPDLSDAARLALKWTALSLASDTKTETGARHFFVYVPEGLEENAGALLDQDAISYAGLRSYRVTPGGDVLIMPVATPAGPKDHR